MYVRPEYRGKGVGRALLLATIESATRRTDVTMLTLTLTEGNLYAQRLYESVGFTTWGIEPSAINTQRGLRGT